MSHYVEYNGEHIPLVKIKGSPITFDLNHLQQSVEALTTGTPCGWPSYNRLLHNPEENAISVNGNIVLLEGNYLLLDQPGWIDLHKYADFTIRIVADKEFLRERLTARKIASGSTPKEAEDFVQYSDIVNAELCLKHSLSADLTLTLNKDNTFSRE